jgi:hypothetical protein
VPQAPKYPVGHKVSSPVIVKRINQSEPQRSLSFAPPLAGVEEGVKPILFLTLYQFAVKKVILVL